MQYSASTHKLEKSFGKRKSSIPRSLQMRARAQSSRKAKSSQAGSVNLGPVMKDASSQHMTRKPEKNFGVPARFPNPESRGTKRGAEFLSSSAGTSVPGWSRVT